jgi:hypothetical protein
MEVESKAEAVNIPTPRFYTNWYHCTKLHGVITDRTTVRILLGITTTGAKAKFILTQGTNDENLTEIKFWPRVLVFLTSTLDGCDQFHAEATLTQCILGNRLDVTQHRFGFGSEEKSPSFYGISACSQSLY